jgi:hypothetical protein
MAMTVELDFGAIFTWVGPVVAIVAVGWFGYAGFCRVRQFFARRGFDERDRMATRRRWNEVEQMMKQPGELGRKMAIIEADTLLDQALKSLSMPGATLGERLKFAAYKYPDLREVWWAHRLRNQLAHEASTHLDEGMARKALAQFKRALERLGAL